MEHPVLRFFLDYLSDLHVPYHITDEIDIDLSKLDLGLRNTILNRSDNTSGNSFRQLEDNTIYHVIDYYECNYFFFHFPDEHKLLFIGPSLTKDISDDDIYDLMNQLQIPAILFSQMQDYYYSLPYISEKGSFFTLMRHIYANIFSVEIPIVHHLDLKTLETQENFLKNHRFSAPEDTSLSMHLLEQRYQMEDRLLDAISHGNTKKVLSMIESMDTFRVTPRTENTLRNHKNLLLSFNTLLRRTAYDAGVHPFYIDAVSSNYATLIEQCRTLDETADISPYLVRSYCDLVKKRSMSSYSEPVRQILVTVDASLTSDLSLKRFANDLYLNTSYLSTLFKKEVGMTLTDYVNKHRISYAKKLLKSTTLSIQDIALQSGIPDIHYFTRLFRREMGMSPREWRNL